MSKLELFRALVESVVHPVLFTDCDHVIRYMNRVAIANHEEGRELLGSSLLDCHEPPAQRRILEVFARMRDEGLEEEMITDDERFRIFMRAVRDEEGGLLGYYERYEPPCGRCE